MAAQLMGKPLGASQFVLLSRPTTAFSGASAKRRGTATKQRIERGMKARYAPWSRVALSQPRVVRRLVVLTVVPVNAVRVATWYERPLC